MPRPGRFPSFYVFALHKSGSTLLNRMLIKAFSHAKVPHLALPELAVSAGLPENEIANPKDFIFPNGYCYRGFRQFPDYLSAPGIAKSKKVLLIRDPRDILVSDYFSVAFSHTLPPRGKIRQEMLKLREFAKRVGVDEYCLSRIAFCKGEFEGYRQLLDGDIRLYRYTDVIFEKRKWLADMLTYFEVAVPERVIDAIAAELDVRPDRERPTEHIRQVTPGNYRRHLNTATIDLINNEFAAILARYSYSH
jgi:hypothetical protein